MSYSYFTTFWTRKGRVLTCQQGMLRDEKTQVFLSSTFLPDSAAHTELSAFGTADGQLYIFTTHRLLKTIKCHDHGVHTIQPHPSGFATSGHDGMVKIWGSSFECITQVDVTSLGHRVSAKVDAIALSPAADAVVVKTSGGELAEISLTDKRMLHMMLHMK